MKKSYVFRKFLITILGFVLFGFACYISVFENTIYSWIVVAMLVKVGVDCWEAVYETTEQYYE